MLNQFYLRHIFVRCIQKSSELKKDEEINDNFI